MIITANRVLHCNAETPEEMHHWIALLQRSKGDTRVQGQEFIIRGETLCHQVIHRSVILTIGHTWKFFQTYNLLALKIDCHDCELCKLIPADPSYEHSSKLEKPSTPPFISRNLSSHLWWVMYIFLNKTVNCIVRVINLTIEYICMLITVKKILVQ